MLGYLGRVTVETGEMIAAPRKSLRLAALVNQVEETGTNALPIVGLLAFLIGVVLAYQGADQLRRFGAEIFTINLLGVGVLREIGGLITAAAGRVPTRGEILQGPGDFEYEVLDADPRRIKRVKIRPLVAQAAKPLSLPTPEAKPDELE